MMTYLRRFARMSTMAIGGRISWGSWRRSLRPHQRSVCLMGGGMVFCDRRGQRTFSRKTGPEKPMTKSHRNVIVAGLHIPPPRHSDIRRYLHLESGSSRWRALVGPLEPPAFEQAGIQ